MAIQEVITGRRRFLPNAYYAFSLNDTTGYYSLVLSGWRAEYHPTYQTALERLCELNSEGTGVEYILLKAALDDSADHHSLTKLQWIGNPAMTEHTLTVKKNLLERGEEVLSVQENMIITYNGVYLVVPAQIM